MNRFFDIDVIYRAFRLGFVAGAFVGVALWELVWSVGGLLWRAIW
jgi:hypothetical protein